MEFEWNEDGTLEYMTVVNIQTGRTRECSLSEKNAMGRCCLVEQVPWN